jgi:carboxymethylenebutenolidase
MIVLGYQNVSITLRMAKPQLSATITLANVPSRKYSPPVNGFNFDATPERYNKAAADLAWQRTIDWFNKYVRS